MQRTDADGRDRGEPFPLLRSPASPQKLRLWLATTTAYPTPPGSGNAYARWFLDQLMPVGPEVGEAADSALLVAAPLLGEVEVVPEVVVRYRRHESNDSDLLAAPSMRFAREVARAEARWEYARSLPEVRTQGLSLPRSSLRRSRELLQLRVAAWRLGQVAEGTTPDSTLQLLVDVLRSPFHPGPESMTTRALIVVWCTVTLLVPRGLVHRLLRMRYAR